MNGIHNTRVLLSASLFSVNLLCILLILSIISKNLFFTDPSLYPLIALFFMIGVILLNLPLQQTILTLIKKNPHQITIAVGLILCLGGLLLLILSKTQLLWFCSIPLILAGLTLSRQALLRPRNELHLLTITSFAYALVFVLLQSIPSFWYLYQQGSLLVSRGAGMITGTSLLLGPSVSGLGIGLLFFVLLWSVFLVTPHKTRKDLLWVCLCLAGLFFIWVGSLTLFGVLSLSFNDVPLFQALFFFFCLIPTFILLFRYHGKEPSTEIAFPRKNQLKRILKNGTVWAAILLFFSTTLLTLFLQVGVSSVDQQKIVFYGKDMVGTWDVPAYGKYGKDAVGMFGLWPVYTTTLGYKTELIVDNKTKLLDQEMILNQTIIRYLNITDYTTIIEAEEITSSLLHGAAVFAIANINESLSREERAVIWEYVQNGGALLVIGDHTDVGGMQTPLNDLLAPVGIQYRFDAALPLDQTFKWLTSLHFAYHPLMIPSTGSQEIQYGVGASLDITPFAFPLVTGAFAFSDEGDRSNVDIAYLGDYEYKNGEQLGDVILVAGSYYGNGRVLVFSDTSSFQNPALPVSYPFLKRTFTWLINGQTAIINTLQVAGSLLLLVGAVGTYLLFKDRTIHFALFPLLLCVSLVTTTSINAMMMNPTGGTSPENLVYIDASHGERFSLESFTDESVNGLIVNLQRNNLLPVVLSSFPKERIIKSTLMIFNAPTKAFTEEEVSFLDSYMTQGGVVILATGFDDKEAAVPLLRTFAVDIEPTPLGPVPYVEGNLTLYQNEPRFVDSWPVTYAENQLLSYYNFTWGDISYHLVVFIQHGAGGLLVISDSQYLLDKNIESIYDYWPGNILFLKYLFDELPLRGDR